MTGPDRREVHWFVGYELFLLLYRMEEAIRFFDGGVFALMGFLSFFLSFSLLALQA